MRVGASRSQIYDGQKVARGRWEQVQSVWDDPVKQEFEEKIWEPIDKFVSDALRAIDQLSVVFNQVRRECEGER